MQSDDDNITLTRKLENIRMKRNNLKESFRICDLELNELKRDLKSNTNQLLSHYHQILNEGTDTRYFYFN
jgi:hypothetical protein